MLDAGRDVAVSIRSAPSSVNRERVAALRDPARRERILREHAELMAAVPDGLMRQLSGGFDVMFRLTDPVDYELDPSDSLAAAAARAGWRWPRAGPGRSDAAAAAPSPSA